ncbi:MAG TPA: class I SAM-dependent methyltransferase [Candidatus Elarobacter sp.]|jgi:SAM-dependent methyltransferase
MRRLVGAEDAARFENPSGDLLWPFLDETQYRSVFDFGCGCGRLARQLLLQRVRPERYLGVDVHLGMVTWCRSNLSTIDPNFRFAHHDTAQPGFNPGSGKPQVKALEAPDAFATLAIACSVFTHIVEDQAEFYLRELARVLAPDGAFIGTWFTFDKRDYPMMQSFQNTLYINPSAPSNAVIYDREWLRRTARAAGLTLARIDPPPIRGEHWWIVMTPAAAGIPEADWPPDTAPYGLSRAPLLPRDAHRIGLTPDAGGDRQMQLASLHALAAAGPGDRVLEVHSADDATACTDPAPCDVGIVSNALEHLPNAELDGLFGTMAEMLRPLGSLVVHTTSEDGNAHTPDRVRQQLQTYFPHVLVWPATAEDPRGSLVRELSPAEERNARDVYAYASHREIDPSWLLPRISTERLDVADDAIRIANATAPGHVRPRDVFAAEVTLSNGTDAVLSSFMPYPVRFAYVWLDEDGNIAGGDQRRSSIAPVLLPHQERRYAVRVEGPERAGRFTLRLTVVQEFVRWFGTRADLVVVVT